MAPTVDVHAVQVELDFGPEPQPEPEQLLVPPTPSPRDEPEPQDEPEEEPVVDGGSSLSFVRTGKYELAGLVLADDGLSVASFDRTTRTWSTDVIDDANLGVGSVIVSVDGWRVKHAKHLRRKLKKVPEGNTVSLQFASGSSKRLVRRYSEDSKQRPASQDLRVRLDLTREATVTVQMKESVSDLKGKIAKEAVRQRVKGSSPEGYADGAFLVMAVVGVHGVRTVLPDELPMRDALMYAERGADEASKQEINYIYLVKYHVPASWRIVGSVRYGMALMWLAMGVMVLAVALTEGAHQCNTEQDLVDGPDPCSAKRAGHTWQAPNLLLPATTCYYCEEWFDHAVDGQLRRVSVAAPGELERRVDDLAAAKTHCEELELFAIVCAVLFILTGLLLGGSWFVRNRQLVRAFKKRRQRGRLRHPALKDKQWAKWMEVVLPVLPLVGWLLLQTRFWTPRAEFHCNDTLHVAVAWLVLPTCIFAPLFCCVLPCLTNNAFYQFMTPDAEEPNSRDGRKLYCCCCNLKFWARRTGRNPLASEKFAEENDRAHEEEEEEEKKNEHMRHEDEEP